MDFLGYKITLGQILFTIIVGLITATIYNKIISPYLSKLFDILSTITSVTKKWRVNRLYKKLSFYNHLRSDTFLRVTYQNSINSEMIFLSLFSISSLFLTILLFSFYGICTVLLQASTLKGIEVADFIVSIFGQDSNLKYESTEYITCAYVFLFVFAVCMFRSVHLFFESSTIAFIDISIESLNSRISKLNDKIR